MIQLLFNIFPISVNKLYVNIPGQKRRFVSTEGKKFKNTIEEEVKKAVSDSNTLHYLSSLLNKKLVVSIEITSSSWYLKDGKTIRKKDISSAEKALIDSIFSAFNELGIALDDSQIFNLLLTKKVGTEDITRVLIGELV